MDEPTAPQEKNNDQPLSAQKIAAIFIAAILLCGLIVWGIISLRATGPSNAAAVSQSSETASSTARAGTFSVAAQPAGRSVVITGTDVPAPTWIVVYDNKVGKAGSTLGAAVALPGHPTLIIRLLRRTLSGRTYLVGEALPRIGTHRYFRNLTVLPVWRTFTAQ